jgi:S1-C subfamily serine protease
MTKHLITVALAAVATVAAACGGARPSDDVTPVAPVASADETTSLQQQFVRVVRAVSPSVVQIRTPQDLGSGVVFDARGDVVTNAHVVAHATRLVVTLASGHSHPAKVVGRDAANDLAVIRIATARPRPATFADSSQVAVGDIAAFPKATASPSPRSSRPARRSTPATPAARSSTCPAA